jgi:hypothetical protein
MGAREDADIYKKEIQLQQCQKLHLLTSTENHLLISSGNTCLNYPHYFKSMSHIHDNFWWVNIIYSLSNATFIIFKNIFLC